MKLLREPLAQWSGAGDYATVLNTRATERDYIPTYPAGSWGPKESHRIFDRVEHRWRHNLDPQSHEE